MSQTNPNDKVALVRGQIDEVKDVMHNNITLVINRGQNIDEMQRKAEIMNEHSGVFMKKSSKLKQAMRCQHIKYSLMFYGLIALIILVLALIIWGDTK